MSYKALPLILFYILTFSNYNFYLLSCELRRVLESHILLRHIVGLLTIYTFIITSLPSFKKKPFAYNMYFSVICYLLFLLSLRVDIRVLLILFILALITIHIDNLIEFEKEEENNEKVLIYEGYRTNLEYIMYTILAVGFIAYFIQIKKESGNQFNLFNFVFGDHICKK